MMVQIVQKQDQRTGNLTEGVVKDADLLDAGVIFGTGFAPFRGGPMHHINSIGAEPLRKELETLVHLRGKRFAPDPGWESLFTSEEGDS